MSVIGPRPGLWNQDILTAERDKYNANDVKPGLCRDYLSGDEILVLKSRESITMIFVHYKVSAVGAEKVSK